MENKDFNQSNEKISNETATELLTAVMERQVKRLFVICILLFFALLGTNVGWIIHESMYEDVVMTQEANTDAGGDISISGVGSGDINNYGLCETDN